jgi:hypothetical protein
MNVLQLFLSDMSNMSMRHNSSIFHILYTDMTITVMDDGIICHSYFALF